MAVCLRCSSASSSAFLVSRPCFSAARASTASAVVAARTSFVNGGETGDNGLQIHCLIPP